MNRLQEGKSEHRITGSAIEIRKIGKYYSSCMMENMGLFMAVGFMEVLFISGGWVPNRDLRILSSFLYQYVVPAFLAYSCGKRLGNRMGGIVSAIAVTGLATTQGCGLLGALLLGPAAGWITGKADDWVKERIPTGFEMLSANLVTAVFGITGMALVHEIMLPLLTTVLDGILTGAEWLMEFQLLPLLSLMIEPLKVLFLNNYINHGLLVPLAAEQLSRQSRSIFFLLETNPGPGLGILLACIFSRKIGKQAGGTYIIIEFLAGIHEVYFPYVMRYPKLFFAVIAGGMSGVFTFSMLDAGLAGTPAPGSVILLTLMAGKECWWQVLLGVAVSALVSFAVGAVILYLEPKLSADKAGSAAAGKIIRRDKGEKDAAEALQIRDGAADLRPKDTWDELQVKGTLRGMQPEDTADGLRVKGPLRGMQPEDTVDGLRVKGPLTGMQPEDTADGLRMKETLRGMQPEDTADGLRVKGTLTGMQPEDTADGLRVKGTLTGVHLQDTLDDLQTQDILAVSVAQSLSGGKERIFQNECVKIEKEEHTETDLAEDSRKNQSAAHAAVIPKTLKTDFGQDGFTDDDTSKTFDSREADKQPQMHENMSHMNQKKLHPSTIYFACDAGFGSSAMAAALMRKKLKKMGITGITVKNCNVEEIPEDADMIFAMYGFEKRLRELAWQSGRLVEFCFVEDLVSAPEYDELIESWN